MIFSQMRRVENMKISHSLICLVCFHCVCVYVCALPVFDSETHLNFNLNPLNDNEKFSSLSVPITITPSESIITKSDKVQRGESYSPEETALDSSIKEHSENSSQLFQSHASSEQKKDDTGKVEKYKEDEKEEHEDDDEEEEEGAHHKYTENHVKDEEDQEQEDEGDEEEEEKDDDDEEEEEEKYNDFDDEDYEDLYAAEFETEYDKHHHHHHHDDHDHLHDHGHKHINIHGDEHGQIQTSSHDCGYHHSDEHSASMDHHFPPHPPPPAPPTTPLPIKGSIDYVLIPMILIGIFGPVFTFMFVLLGNIETKMPLPTARSITLEDSPHRGSHFDGVSGSAFEAVTSFYESYDGCSQKLVCKTASFARRSSLIDPDQLPDFSSVDFVVKNLPRTIRRHFKALRWAMNNPNADCDVFKCHLSLFS